jgi:hypothetical protein
MFGVLLVKLQVELLVMNSCVDVSDGVDVYDGVVDECVVMLSMSSCDVGRVVSMNGVVTIFDCGVVVCCWLCRVCNCIFDMDCGKLIIKAVAGSFLT